MKAAKLIASLLISLPTTVAFAYNNSGYPYTISSGCTAEGTAKSDAYGFYQNNCTSYAAHMLRKYDVQFTNGYRGAHWGDANKWDYAASDVSGPNIPVDSYPLPGDIAYWNTGEFGHVAWVEKVHFTNGVPVSVDITEYNKSPACGWGTRTVSVNDPEGYIHVLAFNEGVTGLHYTDCYEMGNICDNQTHQEWEWILERVAQYRCTSCGGAYQDVAAAFYGGGGFGASESPGPMPVTGGTNGGSLPNLIPNNSDIENASKQKVTMLHINEPGYCRMQTKNIGSQSAGAFQSRCYISDGSKIDNTPRDEGKEDTQSLGAGDTHTEHEDFIAPEYPGVYNAVWCTDSAKQVTESNEGDNCHVEDVFTVWSNPDLITSSVVLGGGKTTLMPNEVFSVDTVITNVGENFGKTILIGYYLNGSQIGTDRIKRENLKGGVGKGENLSKAVAPGIAGAYTLMVCSDIGNTVQETNENNNCLSVPLQVISPASPPSPASKKTSPAVLQLLFN